MQINFRELNHSKNCYKR